MQVKETVFQPKLSACYRERGEHSRISQIHVTSIGIKESAKFNNSNYRWGKDIVFNICSSPFWIMWEGYLIHLLGVKRMPRKAPVLVAWKNNLCTQHGLFLIGDTGEKEVLLPRAFLSSPIPEELRAPFRCLRVFRLCSPLSGEWLCALYLSLMNKSLKKFYLKHSRRVSALATQNLYWCESILKVVFLCR